MDTLLRTELDTIAVGTQMLKRELFLMEQCPAALHKSIFELLFSQITRLELHVGAFMARYMSAGFSQPMDGASRILEELWGVFLILERMYSTLSMLENQAEGAVLHPAELKQLQICWVRLNRLTKQVKEQLKEGKLLAAGKGRAAFH